MRQDAEAISPRTAVKHQHISKLYQIEKHLAQVFSVSTPTYPTYFHQETCDVGGIFMSGIDEVPGTNGPLWLMSFAGPEVRYLDALKQLQVS